MCLSFTPFVIYIKYPHIRKFIVKSFQKKAAAQYALDCRSVTSNHFDNFRRRSDQLRTELVATTNLRGTSQVTFFKSFERRKYSINRPIFLEKRFLG